MKRKNQQQLTGIDLLMDICDNPRKYDHIVNAPSWMDAATYLIESGYQLKIDQRPIIMRRELTPNRMLSISTEAKRELNLN